MNYNTEIRTNSSGFSPSIVLDPGIWNLFVTAPTWMSGAVSTVQVSDNTNIFFNLKVDNKLISFSENSVQQINGGISLRVNNIIPVSGFYLVAKKNDN